jgi:putative spermidine/putrescine transport system permease protein
MAVSAAPTPQPFRTRLSAFFYRHRWLKLALLLLPPLLWICVVYLGALAALLAHSLWTTNDLTQEVERTWSLDHFRTLWEPDVYRTITLRTVGIAAAVTITDAILAFPLAYYMVRIASPRWRAIVFVGVLMPLWSSYLVRVYTWRLIMSDNGFANWTLEKLGFGSVDIAYSMWALWITESYIWLPFMILPIYAALERIPPSLLEASGDLGARIGITFRRVILPLALPGIAAGSIFTFSLTMGDYIAPVLVSNTQFIGNVIYSNVGVANNLPFAAAFTVVPIVIMAIYLTIVRRLGAFEGL